MSSSPSLQNDALQRIEKFVEPPSFDREKARRPDVGDVASSWEVVLFGLVGKAKGKRTPNRMKEIYSMYQIVSI